MAHLYPYKHLQTHTWLQLVSLSCCFETMNSTKPKPKPKRMRIEAKDESSASRQVLIGVAFDRSSSMQSMPKAPDILAKFFQDQLETKAMVTLVTFDDEVKVVVDHVPINDLPELSDHLVPRGSTALFDGVATTIDVLEKHALGKTKVIVVILTDGEENSSTKTTQAAFIKRIAAKRRANWEFIFLAANQDACVVGQTLGFDKGACLTLDSTESSLSAGLDAARVQLQRSVTHNTRVAFTPAQRAHTAPTQLPSQVSTTKPVPCTPRMPQMPQMKRQLSYNPDLVPLPPLPKATMTHASRCCGGGGTKTKVKEEDVPIYVVMAAECEDDDGKNEQECQVIFKFPDAKYLALELDNDFDGIMENFNDVIGERNLHVANNMHVVCAIDEKDIAGHVVVEYYVD